MFDFTKKERGAVAVFLILILVPMITCASIFVEAARVKLAQPVVASAGELAINTVLTEYDYDLNDYYGMLASAQNVDDVITAAQTYFKACLVSQGVDTTFAEKYENIIAGMFNGDASISDFLDISVVESEDNFIKPATNGALNNAALIKAQVINFMKFRSPINAASSLLESFKKLGKEVESIPDQTECLDNQQEFYDTEEALLEVANEAYELIKEYVDLKISKTYVDNMKISVGKYQDVYYRVHKKLVYDLAGTDGLPSFQKKTINYNQTVTTYSANKKPSFNNTKQLLTNVVDAMASYITAKKSLKTISEGFTHNSESATYKTRYYVNIMKELAANKQYDNYVTKANDLSKKVAKLKNAYENLGVEGSGSNWNVTVSVKDGVNTSGEKHIRDHYEALILQFESIVNDDFLNTKSFYHAFSNRMDGISNDISKAPSKVPAKASDMPDGGIKRSDANTQITTVYDDINGYYDRVSVGYDLVDDSVKKLNSLKNLITDYRSDYSKWKNSANKESLDGSGVGEASRSDIEKRERNPEVMNNITEEKVQALINRLNNIKSALGEVKRVLDGFKYNGKNIREIEDLSDFEKYSGVKAENISTLKSEISNYVDTTFSFESVSSTLNITNNNNPDIDNVNPPPIYIWMKGFFAEKKIQTKYDYSKKDAKAKYKDLKGTKDKGMNDKETSESKVSKEELHKAPNLPSKSPSTDALSTEKSSDMTKLSEFITDLFGDFSGTITKAGTTLRDNLYSLDYIMSMFSYDTYESEGMLELWVEKNPDKKIELGTDFKTSTKEQWSNTDLTFKNNKSLTNHMINESTCYSFGNEVEYILYGDKNADNKASIYGTIYMIRLALNVGPVFSVFFNHPTVNSLAISISAATCGVVPEALIKFAICLGLAVAESAVDLSYIKKGIGIKLIKSTKPVSELFMSFEGEGEMKSDGSSSGATGIEAPMYLQYSDYVSMLLFMSLLNSEKADAMYLRMADVVQSNVGKLTKNKDNYMLSRANVYYTINADIKVNPLLFEAPLIDNSIREINNGTTYGSLEASKWNTFSYSATRGY